MKAGRRSYEWPYQLVVHCQDSAEWFNPQSARMPSVNAAQRPKRTGSTREDTARFEATRIAESINALPAAITAPETPELLRIAGVDCFFLQVRTLIEFLGIKQARAPKGAPADWTAAMTLGMPQWSPPKLSQADHDTLMSYWDQSSKHLAHFFQSRPAPLPIYRDDLDEIADKILGAWDEYADASQNNPLLPHRIDLGGTLRAAGLSIARGAPSGRGQEVLSAVELVTAWS